MRICTLPAKADETASLLDATRLQLANATACAQQEKEEVEEEYLRQVRDATRQLTLAEEELKQLHMERTTLLKHDMKVR